MQAFGHELNTYAQVGGGVMNQYSPAPGRADRLAANIPGAVQSSWGNNGDHMTSGLGGANQ